MITVKKCFFLFGIQHIQVERSRCSSLSSSERVVKRFVLLLTPLKLYEGTLSSFLVVHAIHISVRRHPPQLAVYIQPHHYLKHIMIKFFYINT